MSRFNHDTIATEYHNLYAVEFFTRLDAWAAEGERMQRECMSNRDNYDLDEVRAVVAHWHKVSPGCRHERIAREILAERLAELPPAIDYAFATDFDAVRRHEHVLYVAMQLRTLLNLRADWEKRGKLTLVEKATACIYTLCDEQPEA